MKSQLKLIAALAFAASLAGPASASAAAALDPYFALVAEFKNSADAAAKAYSSCGTNTDCQLVAASKKNMLVINSNLALSARSLYPGNPTQAFQHMFDKMSQRTQKIKEDLVQCGAASKKCQTIARTMSDQNFADELRARRAYTAFAQAELARLQAAVSSCGTSQASSASDGSGTGGLVSDAFSATPAMNAPTAKTEQKATTTTSGL